MTKNIRSLSERWAMEMIESRGFPERVENRPATSSGSPSIQAANPGEASRLLSFIASANRSLAGENDSRSRTPTFWNGGDCTAWITPPMSKSSPPRQAWSRMFESRICSRLEIGSTSMPMSASRPETAEAIRSR